MILIVITGSIDYIMNGEKVTIYDDKLVFKKSCLIFTLRGDVLG